MKWKDSLEKTTITLSLTALGFGFCTLAVFILASGTMAVESWINCILGMVVGTLFIVSAFYFVRHGATGYGKPIERLITKRKDST